MRRALYALPLLLTGCAPAAWQAGLDTAATVVDTAAVVRARQIGLCGDVAPRQLASSADVLVMLGEIEALKRDLADAQARLTQMALDRATAPPVSTSPALAPLPPP